MASQLRVFLGAAERRDRRFAETFYRGIHGSDTCGDDHDVWTRGRTGSAVAVVVAFIAAGYGGGDTAQKLDLARRSLLPPDADVIDEQRSQCRMLSADESCLMTLFVLTGGLRERERLIREAAESGGWKARVRFAALAASS